MAMPAATTSAKSLLKKLLFHSPPTPPSRTSPLRFSVPAITRATYGTLRNKSKSETSKKQKQKADLLVKRRTRSERELDEDGFSKQYGDENSAHVPVMLGEVLDVFSSISLKSFVDCTLGAGGHSAAMIQAHPEMEFYVGLDVDPVAHQIAQEKISKVLHRDSDHSTASLQVHTHLKNFKSIKDVLHGIDGNISTTGVQGILMDLGMSSMQVNNAERGFSVLSDGPLDMRMNPQVTTAALPQGFCHRLIMTLLGSSVPVDVPGFVYSLSISVSVPCTNRRYQANLKAEDILNLWSDAEVGRILRDYGEESNWFSLQKKIVRARLTGGLHSTRELVDLIRGSTSWTRGGRQGWIKTATRVFQALRIAVNDELDTLKDSINSSFDSLSSGGRLAVISFHSLEDRIVKQTFLDIVSSGGEERQNLSNSLILDSYKEKEAWIKQMVQGPNAIILTKRPITPSESEERLNPRSRSAKLRVIQKI